MEAGNAERRAQNKGRMVIVPGREKEAAFWTGDVRWLDATEYGCRIHLFFGEDSSTLLTTLPLAVVVAMINEVQP